MCYINYVKQEMCAFERYIHVHVCTIVLRVNTAQVFHIPSQVDPKSLVSGMSAVSIPAKQISRYTLKPTCRIGNVIHALTGGAKPRNVFIFLKHITSEIDTLSMVPHCSCHIRSKLRLVANAIDFHHFGMNNPTLFT